MSLGTAPGPAAPETERCRGLRSTHVALGRSARVRVVDDPYASVFALACAGVRDRIACRDTAFARACSGLSPEALTAFWRVVAPGASLSPDCLTPVIDDGDTTPARERMGEHLDRLRATSAAGLLTDLDVTFAGNPPPRWEAVRAAPCRWLHDLTDGLETLWEAVVPEWHRQRALRDDETARIGRASVTGSLDLALAAAHPRGRTAPSGFAFPDPDGVHSSVGERVVVLNPLLAGLHLTVSNLDRPDEVFFAYPARPRTPRGPVASAELDALLTGPRATLLTLASSGPAMSELATATHLAPASVTHHVDWLQRCDLVERRREGRIVRVSTTARGQRLLALYSAPGS